MKDKTRGKLVQTVLRNGAERTKVDSNTVAKTDEDDHAPEAGNNDEVDMLKFTADIDHRLGTLEKIVGSSSMTLDEVRILLVV